jgi:hypothetical protein
MVVVSSKSGAVHSKGGYTATELASKAGCHWDLIIIGYAELRLELISLTGATSLSAQSGSTDIEGAGKRA